MTVNGNLWSGLTTENHLGYLFSSCSQNRYSNEYEVRDKLILYYENQKSLIKASPGCELDNFILIKNYLDTGGIDNKKLVKLNRFLRSDEENEYLLLMGLLSNIFKNKK